MSYFRISIEQTDPSRPPKETLAYGRAPIRGLSEHGCAGLTNQATGCQQMGIDPDIS